MHRLVPHRHLVLLLRSITRLPWHNNIALVVSKRCPSASFAEWVIFQLLFKLFPFPSQFIFFFSSLLLFFLLDLILNLHEIIPLLFLFIFVYHWIHLNLLLLLLLLHLRGRRRIALVTAVSTRYASWKHWVLRHLILLRIGLWSTSVVVLRGKRLLHWKRLITRHILRNRLLLV